LAFSITIRCSPMLSTARRGRFQFSSGCLQVVATAPAGIARFTCWSSPRLLLQPHAPVTWPTVGSSLALCKGLTGLPSTPLPYHIIDHITTQTRGQIQTFLVVSYGSTGTRQPLGGPPLATALLGVPARPPFLPLGRMTPYPHFEKKFGTPFPS